MSIYPVGFLIFMISLAVLLFNRQWFFYITIFFITFSSTAVIQLGTNSISLPFMLMCVTLVYFSLLVVAKLRVPYQKVNKWIYGHLLLITFILLGSSLMPYFIDGELMVLDKFTDLLSAAYHIPLRGSMQYITQLLYTLLGIWFTYVLIEKINTFIKWLKVVKVLIISCAFISLWGLFEFSTYYIGIDYPATLFSNLGLNSQGINMLHNMPRISSVTLEPSAIAQTLSFVIPLLGWLRHSGHVFFSRRIDKWLLILFAVTFALCNSSTAYIVIVFYFLQYFWTIVINKGKLVYRVIIIALFIAIFIAAVPFMVDYAIFKLSDYSGQERTLAAVSGVQYFLEYPLLGIGWGVFHVWDFIICVACGAGILGLLAFLLFFYKIWRKLSAAGKFTKQAKALGYAALAFMVAVQVSGFLYYTQYTWFYLGIVLSFISIKEKEFNETTKSIDNNSMP